MLPLTRMIRPLRAWAPSFPPTFSPLTLRLPTLIAAPRMITLSRACQLPPPWPIPPQASRVPSPSTEACFNSRTLHNPRRPLLAWLSLTSRIIIINKIWSEIPPPTFLAERLTPAKSSINSRNISCPNTLNIMIRKSSSLYTSSLTSTWSLK